MDSEQHKFERPDVPAAATVPPVAPSAAAAAATARVADAGLEVDLSAEIAANIEREPGDRVRVTRISGCHYRCNWWASAVDTSAATQSMPGLVTTTHRVRKSRFLSVTKVGGGLLINDRSKQTGTVAPQN